MQTLFKGRLSKLFVLQKGKVLRVLKGNEEDHDSSAFKEAFSKHVIQPLLGADYIVSLVRKG